MDQLPGPTAHHMLGADTAPNILGHCHGGSVRARSLSDSDRGPQLLQVSGQRADKRKSFNIALGTSRRFS